MLQAAATRKRRAAKPSGSAVEIEGPIDTPRESRSAADQLAAKGRNGDTALAHMTPGEISVPLRVQQQPGVLPALARGFSAAGLDLERYRVGGEGDSENPDSGAPEFFDPGDPKGDRDPSGNAPTGSAEAADAATGQGGDNATSDRMRSREQGRPAIGFGQAVQEAMQEVTANPMNAAIAAAPFGSAVLGVDMLGRVNEKIGGQPKDWGGPTDPGPGRTVDGAPATASAAPAQDQAQAQDIIRIPPSGNQPSTPGFIAGSGRGTGPRPWWVTMQSVGPGAIRPRGFLGNDETITLTPRRNPDTGLEEFADPLGTPDELGRVKPLAANVAKPVDIPKPTAANVNFDESVASHITNLTKADNPYMQGARARGFATANARGLLNSSIAGEAAEKAAIDAALPIAAQDAATGAARNLSDQNFRQSQAMATQGFGYDEYLADQALRNTQAVNTQGQIHDTKMQNERLASAERIAAADREARLALGSLDADTRTNLAALDDTRQRDIANLQVASTNRSQAMSAAINIQSNYVQSVNSINSNPNIPADVRDRYLANASAQLDSQMALIEQLYNVDLTWSSGAVQVAA